MKDSVEASGETPRVTATGDFIAQATDHSHASVTVTQHTYQYAPPPPLDEATLAAARRRLEELPVEAIPDPTSLPPGWCMDLSRNSQFVGRADDLRAIVRMVKADRGTTPTVVVHGLGGVGKTQLATEVVYRYGQYFAGSVFWLSFAEPEAILTEVAACEGRRTSARGRTTPP